MKRTGRKRARRIRFPQDRAGNAGLIATVVIAFAGVAVGAVSSYLGERGAVAAAHTPDASEPADAVRAERERVVARILSGAAPERLRPPQGNPQAYVRPPAALRPKIVIILDDMGVDRRNSERAIALPGPVTYSFLPYAHKVEDIAEQARAAGGELMLHLPMEPEGAADPGPHALRSDMTGGEFVKSLEWNLERFDGYVGVNNHMGSRLTSDIAAMKTLLAYLDEKGFFFVDSVTTSNSAAQQAAREIGVGIFTRDVFLDDVIGDKDAVKSQLALAEQIAQETGYVVAIGHPRKETLDVLGPWLTTAPARGFDLVFASALAEVNQQAQLQSLAAAPELRY